MERMYRQLTGEVLAETARILKSGQPVKKTRVGLTTLGSEVPLADLVQGARLAMERNNGLEVVLIGPPAPESNLTVYEANNEEDVHHSLEDLLDSGELDGVVTMHYPFPIGVATVGRVVTPARGREMFIATTTGTSDTDRIQAMVKNTVYGIAVARANGIENPRVGILNVEGARQVERHLKAMQERGYNFTWGESSRSDGGQVMRGNDLIMGSVDVLVTDTLTGNILMKMFSAFGSGGNYETSGYGYGPGVGKDFDRLICILSRASGTPVVAGAIEFCASVHRGGLAQIKKQEISRAEKAGWIVPANKVENRETEEEIKAPPVKVADSQIAGIDILEIDDAVRALWKNQVFAASGMGCTGPVILIAGEDRDRAIQVLKEAQFL